MWEQNKISSIECLNPVIVEYKSLAACLERIGEETIAFCIQFHATPKRSRNWHCKGKKALLAIHGIEFLTCFLAQFNLAPVTSEINGKEKGEKIMGNFCDKLP